MIVLVLSYVWCTCRIVFQHTVCTIVVEATECAVIDAGVLLSILSTHMHINDSILHLPVLLHFVFKKFFFVNDIIHHCRSVFVIAQEVIHFLTHDNALSTVLLVPVNNKKVQAHTKYTIDNLEAVEHLLYGVIVRKVVDLVLTLVALAVILHNSFKVAVVYHCHGSMAICVSTITIEAMHRVLQPVITLLLKLTLVHKYMIENNTDL